MLNFKREILYPFNLEIRVYRMYRLYLKSNQKSYVLVAQLNTPCNVQRFVFLSIQTNGPPLSPLHDELYLLLSMSCAQNIFSVTICSLSVILLFHGAARHAEFSTFIFACCKYCAFVFWALSLVAPQPNDTNCSQ